MKKVLITIILCVLSILGFAANQIDSLINVFDQELSKTKYYVGLRQARIMHLNQQLGYSASNPHSKYSIYKQIADEYMHYQCDSAIVYLQKCIELGNKNNNIKWINDAKLPLASLLASIGFYLEASSLVSEVDRNTISSDKLVNYYACMAKVYGEASAYGKLWHNKWHYANVSGSYTDSLLMALPPYSDSGLRIKEERARYSKDFEEAMKINDLRLRKIQKNTQEHAMVAFSRSLNYDWMKEAEKEKKWLIITSLIDLRLGVTDNGAAWKLASIMHNEGDVKRANDYFNYSMNNSHIYNARLRTMQVGVQSFISESYQLRQEASKEKLQYVLMFISVIVTVLALIVTNYIKHNRRLAMANKKINSSNNELQKLNAELSKINKKLKKTNSALNESNHVKEEYVGHFFSLCSSYIDKIEELRRDIYKKALNGQKDDIIKLTKNPNLLKQEINEFYNSFDTTFLQIYPTFVKEFNALLLDEEQIVLKKDELLNAELRIFALVRLGIDSSAKISELLRYSPNTIYNYRAKIKNKAKGSREDFENDVKNIGISLRFGS